MLYAYIYLTNVSIPAFRILLYVYAYGRSSYGVPVHGISTTPPN